MPPPETFSICWKWSRESAYDVPGPYWCICLTTCTWKNRLHLPPHQKYHLFITRKTYHYAYARQTQNNWKKKQRKNKKGKVYRLLTAICMMPGINIPGPTTKYMHRSMRSWYHNRKFYISIRSTKPLWIASAVSSRVWESNIIDGNKIPHFTFHTYNKWKISPRLIFASWFLLHRSLVFSLHMRRFWSLIYFVFLNIKVRAHILIRALFFTYSCYAPKIA